MKENNQMKERFLKLEYYFKEQHQKYRSIVKPKYQVGFENKKYKILKIHPDIEEFKKAAIIFFVTNELISFLRYKKLNLKLYVSKLNEYRYEVLDKKNHMIITVYENEI